LPSVEWRLGWRRATKGSPNETNSAARCRPRSIGIARTFAYGGSKGRLIYDPACKPTEHQTADSYLNSNGATIYHFYEILLRLKDRMNTPTGKMIAEQRHRFLEDFLKQFYEECEGE
jgi:uncharacterized protein